jgi:hypothetical protein
MPPVARESKAVLPDPGKSRAMPPFAGETEAVLPDPREPKAMSPIAGETQAMSPVVKPKPLPDGLTLSCKTPPQPATTPLQSSNVEKLKLPPPTMLFEQEPWDPPDMLVLSNKILPQPAFSNVEGLRLPPPTMVFTLINVQGTLTGSPVTFWWDRTNVDAFSLVLKPSHWQSTTLHGQPHRRCMSNLNADVADIAGTRKTSSPMSAPLMPYGRPFCQHLHHHRRRDKLIAGLRKTSSPTSGSLMPYGRPFHQHLHRWKPEMGVCLRAHQRPHQRTPR